MTMLRNLLAALWNYLREVSGENEYPRYCARELAHGHEPMTAQAFYLWRINRQHSRINRCC